MVRVFAGARVGAGAGNGGDKRRHDVLRVMFQVARCCRHAGRLVGRTPPCLSSSLFLFFMPSFLFHPPPSAWRSEPKQHQQVLITIHFFVVAYNTDPVEKGRETDEAFWIELCLGCECWVGPRCLSTIPLSASLNLGFGRVTLGCGFASSRGRRGHSYASHEPFFLGKACLPVSCSFSSPRIVVFGGSCSYYFSPRVLGVRCSQSTISPPRSRVVGPRIGRATS